MQIIHTLKINGIETECEIIAKHLPTEGNGITEPYYPEACEVYSIKSAIDGTEYIEHFSQAQIDELSDLVFYKFKNKDY